MAGASRAAMATGLPPMSSASMRDTDAAIGFRLKSSGNDRAHWKDGLNRASVSL